VSDRSVREADGAAGQRPPAGADTAPQAVAANVEPQPVAANVEPQPVVSPLTGAAIFLVAAIGQGPQHADAVRGLCADLAGLIRAVGFRDLDGHLTCVTGFGAQAWDRVAPGRLAGGRRPAGLHPFREIRAGQRHAVSTPGDMLFHIRAARMDLCFELATQIIGRLGTAVTVLDEVHGFRYFDDRDLVGFVDGTENPVGQAAVRATIIGAEDPAFAGGSYVIVQKYLHDLAAWNAIPVEQQERIIGRGKLSDVELEDSVKPSYAHNALTTITDENGEEVKIVRDNMPFGSVGDGEYGTYFIGYARSPAVTEQMLTNMFVGSPEGNYDRLLDVSTAVTGNLFFVPSADLLESLGDDEPAAPDDGDAAPPPGPPGDSGSLNIGSLRGVSEDE
jgi:porphyrinogen peroxidase